MSKQECPICGLDIRNCGHENDTQVKQHFRIKALEESILEFVRCENAFGHWAQHETSECADCARVKKAQIALGYTDEAINLWIKNHMRIYDEPKTR
jgi:hypothetical protein